MLLQDLISSKPELVLPGQQLDEISRFSYFRGWITSGGRISNELYSHLMKARLGFTKLKHLLRPPDFWLSIKIEIGATAHGHWEQIFEKFWCLNTVVCVILIEFRGTSCIIKSEVRRNVQGPRVHSLKQHWIRISHDGCPCSKNVRLSVHCWTIERCFAVVSPWHWIVCEIIIPWTGSLVEFDCRFGAGEITSTWQ